MVVGNAVVDTAIDAGIAAVTGDQFDLVDSLKTNLAINAVTMGVGGMLSNSAKISRLAKRADDFLTGALKITTRAEGEVAKATVRKAAQRAEKRVVREGMQGSIDSAVKRIGDEVLPGPFKYGSEKIEGYEQHHLWPVAMGGPEEGWIVYAKKPHYNADGLQGRLNSYLQDKLGMSQRELEEWARENPDKILDTLRDFYKDENIPFPCRGGTMSIETQLTALLRQTHLMIPDSRCSGERISKVVGQQPRKSGGCWLVPCKHETNRAASIEQIAETEAALDRKLPDELKEFLRLTDGGRFYITPSKWLWHVIPNARTVRFEILGTANLTKVNGELLQQFRLMLGRDKDFKHIQRLNYLAFCDGHDGNFLAVLTEGPEAGIVFFLHHEYLFRPYSAEDTDLYYTVAPSFQRWLALVVESHGWEGFGRFAPII